MSIEYVRAVCELDKNIVIGQQRYLLTIIAEHANSQGLADPGDECLARETGIDERQIRRLIPQLEAAGLIETVRRGIGKGNRRKVRLLFAPACLTKKRTIAAKADIQPSFADQKEGIQSSFPVETEGQKSEEKRTNGAIKEDTLPEVEADNPNYNPNSNCKTAGGVDLDPVIAAPTPPPPQNVLPVAEKPKPTAPPAKPLPIPAAAAPLPVAVDALTPPLVQDSYAAAQGFRFASDDPPLRQPDPGSPLGPHAKPAKPGTEFDPRLVGEDGLINPGTGRSLWEIWRESFTWDVTPAQRRWMKANVTDPTRWRQVTAECAVRGFKTFTNVCQVYQFGFEERNHDGKHPQFNRPSSGHSSAGHSRNKPAPAAGKSKFDEKTLATTRLTARLINGEIDEAEYERQLAALVGASLPNLQGSQAHLAR